MSPPRARHEARPVTVPARPNGITRTRAPTSPDAGAFSARSPTYRDAQSLAAVDLDQQATSGCATVDFRLTLRLVVLCRHSRSSISRSAPLSTTLIDWSPALAGRGDEGSPNLAGHENAVFAPRMTPDRITRRRDGAVRLARTATERKRPIARVGWNGKLPSEPVICLCAAIHLTRTEMTAGFHPCPRDRHKPDQPLRVFAAPEKNWEAGLESQSPRTPRCAGRRWSPKSTMRAQIECAANGTVGRFSPMFHPIWIPAPAVPCAG